MRPVEPLKAKYTENDLDFVIEAAAPQAKDRELIKRAFREDEEFRKAILADDRVFHRLIQEGEQLVHVSPALYFEVLLRKAQQELERASHTMERVSTQRVPVFDTTEVMEVMRRPEAIDYLAQMLASFTKVESYTVPIRIRRGVWRKIRFSDTDIDSLIRLCQEADEEHRLAFYKRIADLCLFILGIFPEFAPNDYRYPASGQPRPAVGAGVRRGLDQYETEARRFYRLAGEHPMAKQLALAELFWLFHDKLNAAKKPLNFISEHYLAVRKRRMFDVES